MIHLLTYALCSYQCARWKSEPKKATQLAQNWHITTTIRSKKLAADQKGLNRLGMPDLSVLGAIWSDSTRFNLSKLWACAGQTPYNKSFGGAWLPFLCVMRGNESHWSICKEGQSVAWLVGWVAAWWDELVRCVQILPSWQDTSWHGWLSVGWVI